MLRSFWQIIKDVIFNSSESEFRDQAEIDDIVADAFSQYAIVTNDARSIPSVYRRRHNTFFDPLDLIEWINAGAIPPTAVSIYIIPVGDDEERYVCYVSDDTDP